jgi:BASS family bile acid:Na+ symporter
MIQRLKDLQLPIAILLGFLFHRFFATINFLTPFLIFVMLYFTLCSVEIKQMKVTWLHVWMLLFQGVVSFGIYLIIVPFNSILAQGSLAIMLAPTAISASVVAAMLGANLSTMVTSTLLSNLAVAVISPFYFSIAGSHSDISFWHSCWLVVNKVAPLILMPLVLALLTRRYLPKLGAAIARRKSITYYLWSISLTIVIGCTIESIFQMNRSQAGILLLMAALSIGFCAVQFAFGRWVGKRYGDVVAGGQSMGQKNTVLSIWMAQTYLNPVSSVIPALYVIWQNLFNSYQLIQKSRKEKRISELLSMVNEDNLHYEIETDGPIGNELW